MVAESGARAGGGRGQRDHDWKKVNKVMQTGTLSGLTYQAERPGINFQPSQAAGKSSLGKLLVDLQRSKGLHQEVVRACYQCSVQLALPWLSRHQQ
jgi:hypothetical protein